MSEAGLDTQVVIVGAGAAGLYAAVLLARNGIDAVVAEARDRVGGRLLSIDLGDGRLDLGATWYWANEPRINNLVATAELDNFDQHTAGQMLFQNGDADPQRMPNQLASPAGRLAQGMQAIPDLLLKQLDPGAVHLGTVVESVVRTGDRVAVTAGATTWTASHVIVALPPALAVHAIEFDGELADAVAQVARSTPVWMGSTVKAVAAYPTPFWRDQGLAGAAFSYVGPMREIHDMSGPAGAPAALFGFCSVGAGAAAPTQQEVVAQLVDLFGDDAANPSQVLIMDWRDEAFTSPPGVERLSNYQTYGHRLFQEPSLDGRLHWASTETSPVAPGHIEGALTAAERAASAVLADLKPTTRAAGGTR